MFVQTEVTPNPNSLKFLPGKNVTMEGSYEITSKEKTDNELVRNILSINGVRYIPVEVIDVAGLVPGAHEGKGMGNKFLDDLRQADVLIQVVDSSGNTDLEGSQLKEQIQ